MTNKNIYNLTNALFFVIINKTYGLNIGGNFDDFPLYFESKIRKKS